MTLDFWVERREFRSRHRRAAAAEPLSKASNPQRPSWIKKKRSSYVALDKGVYQMPVEKKEKKKY